MSASVCFIALSPDAQVTPNKIFDTYRKLWHGYPPLTDLDRGNGAATFKIGTANGFIVRMNMPIPYGDLEEPCKASFIWPTASQDLLSHTSHYVVSVTECGGPLETAAAITRLVAAILTACDGAIGVYNGNAGLVASSKFYQEQAIQLLTNDHPLLIWMGVRLAKMTYGGTCGHTVGLSSLGNCEIEVPSSKLSANELAPKLYDMALYMLTNGATVKEGDTVGYSMNEKIRVTYGRSEFGLEGRVMRLQFEAKGPFGNR